MIQHLEPVKCKQFDDGCQWEGAIHDYQNTVSITNIIFSKNSHFTILLGFNLTHGKNRDFLSGIYNLKK